MTTARFPRRAFRWIAPAAAVVLTMLLSACAATGPRERQAARLAEFEAVAGTPVDRFRFWNMQRWELLGPQAVAVWTGVNEAWLIEVNRPCSGLEFASTIGLTSTQNQVSSKFDAVLFDQQRCMIRQIRPVDGKALKELRRASG